MCRFARLHMANDQAATYPRVAPQWIFKHVQNATGGLIEAIDAQVGGYLCVIPVEFVTVKTE